MLLQFYKLKELVKANTNDPTQTHVRRKLKNKVTINWTTISKEMNRQYQSCVVRMYVRYISYQYYHIIEWYFISLNSMNWSYDMLWYSQNNWKHIKNQSLKQGPFTADEDDIIINKLLEALTEYGKVPRGIWVEISHGLNRDLNSVYEHWRQVLSKKSFDNIQQFSYEE